MKNQKPKIIVWGFIALFCLSFRFLSTPNPPPDGYTGSPFGFGDCTFCHSDYNVNSGPGTATLTTTIPACGYVPLTTYSITVTVSHNGLNEFQFQLTSESSTGAYRGTLNPNAVTQFYGGKYISGTGASLSNPNTNSWTFTWTAPATGLGPVTFYAAFNAVNGDIDVTGDYVYTRTLTVPEAGPYSASITSTNVSCFGDCNGTATVNAVCGNSPYTYQWNTGATTSTITGLCASNYSVLVTDATATTTTSTVTISQPPSLILSPVVTPVSCNGGANGSACAAVSGGTPGYTYLWNPSGATASCVTGLSAGNYTVTVTDANGCTIVAITTITQPAASLTSSVTIVSPICGNNNGSASVTPSGGTSPYTYLWSNGNSTSAVTGLTGFPPDTLIVTVTDANGCTVIDTAIVNCYNAVTENNIGVDFNIYPNPNSGAFDLMLNVSENNDYTIELRNVLGEIIYSEELKAFNGKYAKRFALSSFRKGVYVVNIRSGNKQIFQKLVVY